MTPEHIAYYLARLPVSEVPAVVARSEAIRSGVRDPVPVEHPAQASPWAWLVERAARYAQVPVDDVLSSSRRRDLVIARAAVVVVLRDVCDANWDAIGLAIGRDRTSAWHAHRVARGDSYEPQLGRLRERLVADVMGEGGRSA